MTDVKAGSSLPNIEEVMPVYSYQCENCGVRFDRYQKFTEQPLAWCPECGKKALRKVYSPVGIVFKGSGFYATDHRSPSGASYAAGKTGEKSSEGEKTTGESSSSTPSSAAPSSTNSPKESKE
jgi:putative FmdB family regulatory protein